MGGDQDCINPGARQCPSEKHSSSGEENGNPGQGMPSKRRPATGNTARCSRDKGDAIPKKVCRGQRGHEEAAADKQASLEVTRARARAAR